MCGSSALARRANRVAATLHSDMQATKNAGDVFSRHDAIAVKHRRRRRVADSYVHIDVWRH